MATFSINNTSNDITHNYQYYEGVASWFYYDTQYLQLGNASDSGYGITYNCNFGLRFTNINISRNSTINSAKITFVDYNSLDYNILSKIEGIDEDNTAAFVESPEDSARTRTKTSAYVSWNISGTQSDGTSRDTPSITTIVQEIVNRSGWSYGNSMAFYLSDNGSSEVAYGNYMDFYDYTESSSYAPKLVITWSEPIYDINVSESTTVTEWTQIPEPGLHVVEQSMTSKSLINQRKYVTMSAKGDLTGEEITPITRTKTLSALAWIQYQSYGVFITKPTYDARLELNIDNYIFNSNYDTLKYYSEGSVLVTVNYANYYASQSSIFGTIYYHRATVEITHGLGYIPYFRGYVSISGNDDMMAPAPFYFADVFYWDFEFVYADANKLYFVVEEKNLDNIGSRTRYFTYKIFRNKLNI